MESRPYCVSDSDEGETIAASERVAKCQSDLCAGLQVKLEARGQYGWDMASIKLINDDQGVH
jgi:hypothetical protein